MKHGRLRVGLAAVLCALLIKGLDPPRVSPAQTGGRNALALYRNSSHLAAAYDLSVTATMLIDSLMAFFVVWRYWDWPLWKATSLMVPIALIEEAFLTANLIKIPEGGWLPLLAAWHRPHSSDLGPWIEQP